MISLQDPNFLIAIIKTILLLAVAYTIPRASRAPPLPPTEKELIKHRDLILRALIFSSKFLIYLFTGCQAFFMWVSIEEISRALGLDFTSSTEDLRSMENWDWIAFALALCGSAMRLWCFKVLGRFFTGKLAIHPNHKLVKYGPYSILRHPSYLGSILMMSGSMMLFLAPHSVLFIFFHRSPILCLLIVFGLTAWILWGHGVVRARKEDEMMKKEFGKEWEQWSRRTWKVLPLVW